VNTVDPLGGSYYLEALTEKMEQEALEYFRKIDSMGGMVAAVEKWLSTTRDTGFGLSISESD
jgi:methylmalonyl-CoA mutase N-terminal domain/subunit